MKKLVIVFSVLSAEAYAENLQFIPSVASPKGTMLSGLIEGNIYSEKHKRLMLGIEFGEEAILDTNDSTLVQTSGAVSLGLDTKYEVPFPLWSGYRFQLGQKRLQQKDFWYVNQTFIFNNEIVVVGIGLTLNQTNIKFQGRSLDRFVVYPFVGLPVTW